MTKSYVTLENFICPVCGEQHDHEAEIIMHNQLKEVFEPTTLVGYKLCKKHQEIVDEGNRIFIIATNTGNIDGLAGKAIQISVKAFEHLFEDADMETVLKKGIVLIDTELFDKLFIE